MAVFEGVSEEAFRTHYLPICRSIATDNLVGHAAFLLTRVAQRLRPLRRMILSVASAEQASATRRRRLSSILWDLFSGSATYTDIFRRMVSPALVARMTLAVPAALLSRGRTSRAKGA